jgi:hypothetical protein
MNRNACSIVLLLATLGGCSGRERSCHHAPVLEATIRLAEVPDGSVGEGAMALPECARLCAPVARAAFAVIGCDRQGRTQLACHYVAPCG